MTDSPTAADQPIGLDLVAPEMLAPVMRRFALIAGVVSIGIGVVIGFFFGPLPGLVTALVLAVPAVGQFLAPRRRRLWLTGNTLYARRLWRTRRLEVPATTGIELLIYPGRISRVVLRLTAGPDRQVVPLALYTDAGSGRELHILGLRRLADALSHSELAAGVAVADLLVHQLRAEARDAGLGERPLYRAVTSVRAKDYVAPIVLTDAEIAALY